MNRYTYIKAKKHIIEGLCVMQIKLKYIYIYICVCVNKEGT